MSKPHHTSLVALTATLLKGALVVSAILVLHAADMSTVNADTDAARIMQEVYEQGRKHPSQRMDMEIRIEDAKKRQRVRLFKVRYRIAGAETKSLIRFYKPADIKGTGLLNIVYDDTRRDTEQWIYFPAFRTVNKLSLEEKHQSFMGSDFTNADIAGRRPSDDEHRLVSSDARVSVIESTPKDAESPYSKIESHVLNEYDVLRKAIFYDRAGKLLKTLHSNKIEKIEGMYLVTKAKMENHQSDGATYMNKQSVNFKEVNPNEINTIKLQNR